MRLPASLPSLPVRLCPALFLALFALGLSPNAYTGTALDAGFAETQFANTGDTITSLGWAPDGSNRLFVTLKGGAVKIVQNATLLSQNFYTFAPYTASECGVLSISFDPNYASNRFVYIFYTASASVQRIVRLTDNNNVGQNLTTIIDNLPTVGANHDGGGTAIGPDHNGNGSYLYWGIGNLGNSTAAGEGTNLTSLASKVGRANLDGSAPNDNPFYNAGDGIGPTDYIWARGFRNPFTMTIQNSTKKLWVTVVGDSYEQIFLVNRGDYVGDRSNENRQPAGPIPSIPPRIKYRTNGSDSFSLAASPTGARRSAGVVTFTTSSSHTLKPGEKVSVTGVGDASFNATYYVSAIVSVTQFTASQVGADAASGSGTVATANLGGCATGGAFYEATAFPASYRGNFFWGDCNSGKLMRATLDASNSVTRVDEFLTQGGGMTDVGMGPDGALYYSTTGGQVFRVAYTAAVQSLVVSTTLLNLVEGNAGTFTVRLSSAPSAPIVVNVARTSGDASVDVTQGAALTFDASNFATPQTVQVSAAEDANTSGGSASINVSASGLTTQQVTVSVSDNDTLALVLSTNALAFIEGGSGSFGVSLSHQPDGNVVVSTQRSSGDTSISVSGGASLTFTPSNYATAQNVTLSAAEDADATADTAVASVSASGIASRDVTVTVQDNDAAPPQITSSPATSAVQGAQYLYDVQASGAPAPSFALGSAPSGMTINATNGVITWQPASTGGFAVSVRATNGVAPDAVQSFTLTVAADRPPACSITSPSQNQTVSGTTAEFFGDGTDDVGTVRAEFYIDGVLAYTDVNTEGHYHFNAGHARWDTTPLSNAAHTLRMTVYDTSGKSASCQVQVTVVNGGLLAPTNLRQQ